VADKLLYEPWEHDPNIGVLNMLIFSCLRSITMGQYSRWVQQSAKEILLSACDEYVQTSDRGSDKTRSKIITRVAKEITDKAAENNEPVPDDVEKVPLILHAIYTATLIIIVRSQLV